MDDDRRYTLITGGSAGIGRSLAFVCARQGHNLLLVALPGRELEETAEEIRKSYSVTVESLAVNLAETDGPQKVWEWCRQKGYRINRLINNAGVAGSAPFEGSDAEYSDVRIMVNVRALVLLTRYMLPELRESAPSRIINIGSLSGYFSIPYKSVYSASKAFVISFSRSLALELEGSGVTVTVVNPNGVKSNSHSSERIRTHGLIGRIVSIESDRLAEIIIESAERNHREVIPLFVNRCLLFLDKLIPWFLKRKILLKEFSKEMRYRS